MAGWIGSAVYRVSEGFVAVDPAMAQALGYTADQMVGRRGREFMYTPDLRLAELAVELAEEGSGCLATTCFRQGVTGGPLWITFEMIPLAPSAPELVLITLLDMHSNGVPSVQALPGSADPAARLKAIDLDFGIMLHRRLSDMCQSIKRFETARGAIASALNDLLAEERPSVSLKERVCELELRLDRVIVLLSTPGP